MTVQGSQLGIFVRTVAFAAKKHRHQRRKGAETPPYINRPLALANVLVIEGYIRDPTALCAAVLHDVIEHLQTTRLAAADGSRSGFRSVLATFTPKSPGAWAQARNLYCKCGGACHCALWDDPFQPESYARRRYFGRHGAALPRGCSDNEEE